MYGRHVICTVGRVTGNIILFLFGLISFWKLTIGKKVEFGNLILGNFCFWRKIFAILRGNYHSAGYFCRFQKKFWIFFLLFFLALLTIATCIELWSASLYTATVRIPSFLAERMTRQAISPRLAISTLLMGVTAINRYKIKGELDLRKV